LEAEVVEDTATLGTPLLLASPREPPDSKGLINSRLTGAVIRTELDGSIIAIELGAGLR
jgi:hypothetical protein